MALKLRPMYPGLFKEPGRNGKTRWRVRSKTGKRITIGVGPEHPRFAERYASARDGVTPPPLKAKAQEGGIEQQFNSQKYLPIPKEALQPEFYKKFWSMVQRNGDECWPWTGSQRDDGYGTIKFPPSRANFRTHRISYFITHRVDPGYKYVCHKCDNPICCNPDHLFLGTAAENNADKEAKGRGTLPPRNEKRVEGLYPRPD